MTNNDNIARAFELDIDLRRAGYAVAPFQQATAALTHIRVAGAQLVITDVFMPEKDGFEVLIALKRDFPSLPIIAVSGSSPAEKPLFLDAMCHLGAQAAFTKPIDETMLLQVVARLVRPARL